MIASLWLLMSGSELMLVLFSCFAHSIFLIMLVRRPSRGMCACDLMACKGPEFLCSECE